MLNRRIRINVLWFLISHGLVAGAVVAGYEITGWVTPIVLLSLALVGLVNAWRKP